VAICVIKLVGEGGRSNGSRFSEKTVVVRAERTVLMMDESEVEVRTEVNIDDKGASEEGVRDGREGKGDERVGEGEEE